MLGSKDHPNLEFNILASYKSTIVIFLVAESDRFKLCCGLNKSLFPWKCFLYRPLPDIMKYTEKCHICICINIFNGVNVPKFPMALPISVFSVFSKAQ